MTREITYKLQGNGKDSWEIKEYVGPVLLNAYMVYEDPYIKPTPDVDVIGMLQKMTPEEINQIKQILS